jgi:hypothetical protein
MSSPQTNFNETARPSVGWRVCRAFSTLAMAGGLGYFCANFGEPNADMQQVFATIGSLCLMGTGLLGYRIADDHIKAHSSQPKPSEFTNS